jgi:octaprenyl-diphosphate synthase
VDPGDEEISEIVHLVRELGGVEYARKRAQEFAEKAYRALGGLPEGPALDSLRGSITYVVDRNR